ncbi:MAG: PilZ domain-containing protein [Methylobacter sp.]|nr:PilZ domain-containing protein [Methylobacter sp.]
MNSNIDRSYRKNLTTHGLIYIGGEELAITVKDLSLTGVFAHLECGSNIRDAKDIFNMLSGSAIIDFFLPEMNLAGEAEVVRVDIANENIMLAFEFKNISYDIDNQLYKRKVYRKNLTAPGKILLDGEYREFITLNVSVDGLMINVPDSVSVKAGDITIFEFELLELEGEIKVVWVEHKAEAGTVLGLHYLHMEKMAVKGIPRFGL